MVAALKTLALIVLLAALGFGGFYAGQILRSVSPTDITADDFIPRAASIQPTDKPYAVPPSVGPLTRSVAADSFAGRDEGLYDIAFPAAARASIQPGQSVVFKDRNGKGSLLPVVGYINHVNDDASAVFKIDPATDEYNDPLPLPDLSGSAARIVTLDTVVKRLPIGALQYDQDGNPYVWKAVPDGQGAHHVLHQNVFAGVQGDDFFEVGTEITLDDLVIANPPADIENGQVRDILVRGMNAPLHGYAGQAEIRRNDEAAQKAHLELAAFQAATTPGGLGACSANISAEGLPSEIVNMKSPLNGGTPSIAGAGATGASGGCSSCSAPPTSAIPGPDATATTPAPASGGCGGCGASGSYGGSPDPVIPDGPASTQ